MAIALTGLVMTAATTFLVMIANIWLDRNDESFFTQHAAGTSTFVKGLFATAESQEEASSGASGPILWNRPPGYSEFDTPLLSFTLREAPALFGEGAAGLTDLRLYLYPTEDDGLFLLWHSNMLEVEDLNDVNHSLVSSLVTEVAYAYYDEEFDDWELEDEPRTGDNVNEFVLPDFLRFLLRDTNDNEYTFYVGIPQERAEIPTF